MFGDSESKYESVADVAKGECATVVKESEAEWKARVAKLPTFQPADYPIADFVRRAVDAGADAELLLLAAADTNHLGVARALVDNHGAVGTIAASDDAERPLAEDSAAGEAHAKAKKKWQKALAVLYAADE